MDRNVMTLERFIIEQERLHPEATGDFPRLLQNITLAAKVISREVNKAGLVDILGTTGLINVQQEEVQKLDVFANQTIKESLDHTGYLCVMATEEDEDIVPIPEQFTTGKYVAMFDPLDGSSNIDVNVSIGTIFSIYKRVTESGPGTREDCLQVGTKQICAGYVLYGSSTMMVFTTGAGVHGFTLDPSIGEFLLSHDHIQIPRRSKIFSANMGNYDYWDEPTRRYVKGLLGRDNDLGKPYSLRYIGSLVADFHRNLLKGGIFLYPADTKDPKKPKGKLRLLYEANPMAFIGEQAGGMATTGTERILEGEPVDLHMRVPLNIGSAEDGKTYEVVVQGQGSLFDAQRAIVQGR